MSNQHKYAVIMAGGIGSRFWPISTTTRPKQFIDILGTGKTLIQHTYERFRQICPAENIYIVTNESYRSLVHEQLPEVSDDQILGEPIAKNTAPCVAYACHKIHKKDPLATVAVAPSDHLIINEGEFCRMINVALEEASKEDKLITLGIRPTRPDTGYGYIQFVENEEKEGLQKVKTFTEKPNIELAKTFIQSGDFLWNAGIFVWSTKSILSAFEKYLPDMQELFNEGKKFYNTNQEAAFINKAYTQCTNISIDYGIMEKASNVFVYPAEFGWSDLGTWGSLYTLLDKDYVGNAVVSSENVMMYDSSGCVINTPGEKLVVIQGLHDYIVVESDTALLICQKSQEQMIKQFAADVKIRKGDKFI
jgi:mannose-1-phosphate guanylyltransferase